MNNFTTSFQQQEPANKIHKHKRLLKVPYYQLLKYQQMILMLQKISHQTTQKKSNGNQEQVLMISIKSIRIFPIKIFK